MASRCTCISYIIGFILLVLQPASAESITISLSTSATVLNIVDRWTLTGIVTMTSQQATVYQTAVKLQLQNYGDSLCSFTYTACTSPRLPDSPVNTCQCTGHTGNDYSFIVRRQGSLADSQKVIEATLFNTDPWGSDLRSSTVTLPLMYKVSGSSPYKFTAAEGVDVTSTAGEDVTLTSDYSFNVTVAGSYYGPTTDVTFPTPNTESRVHVIVDFGSSNYDTFSFTLKVPDLTTVSSTSTRITSTMYRPDIPDTATVDPIVGPIDSTTSQDTTEDTNKTDHSFSNVLLPSALVVFLGVTSVLLLHLN